MFEFCRRNSVPGLFVLAGGYQEPIRTKLLSLQVNTSGRRMEFTANPEW